MRTTAFLTFGLWVGCGSSQPPAAVGGSGRGVERESSLLGVYDCRIGNAEDHYQYDFFRCVIERRNGALVLDKQGGSQRFIGAIAANPEGGFGFTGRFFCPYGDCDQTLVGTFAAVRPGAGQPITQFRGAFVDSNLLVTLRWRSRASTAYGGAGYGGVTYGALGADGADGTGGQTYGGPAREGVNGANW
ncbi:MAG: hypothetical protein KBG15_20730 [Kofleriaceae bacterium]|nr:hypothetical protein [Kofleriaceae bacterium]